MLPIQLKLTKARSLENKGKHQEALEIFMEVKAQKPENISTYVNMAELYHKTNRVKDGLDTIEEGLTKSPTNTELLLRKGILLVVDNQLGEGEAILQDLLKKDPEIGEAWNYLGISFFKRGLMDKALEAYRNSEKIDSTNAVLFNNLGTLFLRKYLKGKDPYFKENALLYFKKALSLNSRLPSALNGIGAAYRFSGDKKEAIRYWKDAIKYKPDFIEVYFNLGITLMETGERAEARHYLDILKEKFYQKLNQRSRNQLDRLLSGLN